MDYREYAVEEIWEAVYYYFPAYREVRDTGFDLNLQSAISGAQERAFQFIFDCLRDGTTIPISKMIKAGEANMVLYHTAMRIRKIGAQKFFNDIDKEIGNGL